ncbi:class I SAM-dependent DNA methyltransferase [Allorhodopirellula heiligendammensis]|uniref:dTDP-3-amino-3,4, 6-trideoxy-alpha-D-glucopyranose n=1 Tax=Allorhodopirellula heiligendammensis TaxID=2714739 RepID=A0A5C6C1A7_9BACT|nr:class I SAM-dependent methyltransferase [Allorhodopirellula heiligendammensis]TWU16974.1 dTDP-3-amino-3,4,6-trideoxy-alpha-D-glucopyranose [Allorhodopirellula heiligendammensis]
MAEPFDNYSRYYDLLYQDKDYRGESDYVRDLLHRFHPAVNSILELGSGTGRHAELFAASGLQVTGVELSTRMFEIASDRAQGVASTNSTAGFSIHQGDARNFRIDQRFDAVISLFHVASYQVSNADILNLFQTASHHLQAGGCFVFDVWYGPAVLAQQPAVRVKRLEDNTIRVLRIAEPTVDTQANRVDVHYTMIISDKTSGEVEQFTERHPMRYYFSPELHLIAEQAGLELVHSEEWMTANKPSPDTWGVTYVARKHSSKGRS